MFPLPLAESLLLVSELRFHTAYGRLKSMNPQEVSPGFQYQGANTPVPSVQPVPQPPVQPTPPSPQIPSPEPAPLPQPSSAPQPAPVTSPTSAPDLIQWNASEFIDHQKNVGWFMLLAIVAVLFAAGLYIVTQDILSTAVVLIAAMAFGVYGRLKPRTLNYSLQAGSLKVGDKVYPYDDFRTFSVVQEGALSSIVLQPTKRFMPPLTIYFSPDDGEKIFDTLAAHLPHQDHAPDMVENLMRKIRF